MKRNDKLISGLNTDFVAKKNYDPIRPGLAVSFFTAIPGLSGFWPGRLYISTNGLVDLSGNNNPLTRNGSSYATVENGLSRVNLDGDDYFSKATTAAFSFSGSTGLYEAPYKGVTIGGWFYHRTQPNVFPMMMGKANLGSVTNRNYALYCNFNSSSKPVFEISNGTTTVSVQSTSDLLTLNTWHFIVGRYQLNTNMSVFIDGDLTNKTTGIPATMQTNSDDFTIGAWHGGLLPMDGQFALAFMTPQWLPDDHVRNLWKVSAGIFT